MCCEIKFCFYPVWWVYTISFILFYNSIDIDIELHLNAIKLKPKWMYEVFKKSFSLMLEVSSFKYILGFKSYQKILVKTPLLQWTHCMWDVFRFLWTREIFVLVSKQLWAKQYCYSAEIRIWKTQVNYHHFTLYSVYLFNVF